MPPEAAESTPWPRSRRPRRHSQQQGLWFTAARPVPRAPSRRRGRSSKSARQKKALEVVMEQSRREHMLSRLPFETYHAETCQDLIECELCLEEYQDGEELMRLPCLHVFHSACVTPWLLSKSSCCPVCQTDLCEAVGV
mmetsp:Transcript_17295/g.54106  ORF Transcript_17295/g.54106 Transcript_17295/m.54106 type:complete len:139 (+) Transcript_17295:1-417(+)